MNSPTTQQFRGQYDRFKAMYPECVIMFHIGEFYEMFYDDAVVASKALGLTLTRRTADIPMAGIPQSMLEVHLKRMIAAGFRVAVCDPIRPN